MLLKKYTPLSDEEIEGVTSLVGPKNRHTIKAMCYVHKLNA